MDDEEDVNNHSVYRNLRNIDQTGTSVREVCEETYHKKLSDEMVTFDNRISNVENAVSSMQRIHVSLGDVLELPANLGKKQDSQPQVNDDIVTTVREIRHDLNTVMEFSSAANAQRVNTLDEGNQAIT